MHVLPFASMVSIPQWVVVMSKAHSALYVWSMFQSQDICAVQLESKIKVSGLGTTGVNLLSELRLFCSVAVESSWLKGAVSMP